MLVAIAVVVLIFKHDSLWNRELGALSPVSQAAQDLDARMRADLGAPDTRTMIVVMADSEEAALQAPNRSPRAAAAARTRRSRRIETPSRYLPSEATQLARRASLPAPQELAARLERATAGLPLRADKLAPFLADVEAARNRPLLQREDLAGSSFELALDPCW